MALIPVRYNPSQKRGHTTSGARIKANEAIIPGTFVYPINAGQMRKHSGTSASGASRVLFLAQKETRLPEDSNASLDVLASGDGMLVFDVPGMEFETSQFHANLTSATVFGAVLGVSATGTVCPIADAADTARPIGHFGQLITNSGGNAPRVRCTWDRV